jgi:hypothetical protein
MDGATAGFLLIGISHLAALIALVWMLLRNGDQSLDAGWFLGGGDDGEPQPPRDPPPRPGGDALPLPDCQPSSVRMRTPGRLAGAHPSPARRPEHKPGRERQPARRG